MEPEKYRVRSQLEELVFGLQSEVEDERLLCLTWLAQVGSEEVLPYLEGATKDGAVPVRVLARQLAAELRQKIELTRERPFGHDPKALVVHENPKARLAGALMCYDLQSDELRTLLLSRITVEDDAFVRASLVKALGKYPDGPVIEVLTECLYDPDPRVRSNTIESLMFYEHPALFARVSNLLHDPDNRVQGTVLIYLARRKPERVRPILEKMATSTEIWARRTARYAYRALGWPPPPEPDLSDSGRNVREMFTHEDPDMRVQAVWRALTLERDERQLLLRQQLGVEQHPHVVATLVRALGMAGLDEDLKTLEPHLASPDPRVRANAIEGIGSIGGPVAVRLLEARLEDEAPRVRSAATLFLARIRRRQAVEILRALVDSDRPEEVTSALHALMQLPADEAKRLAGILNQAVDTERRQELHKQLDSLRHRSTGTALQELQQALVAIPLRAASSSGLPKLSALDPRDERRLASLGLDLLRAWESARYRPVAFEELVTEILAAEEGLGQGVLVAENIHRRHQQLVKLGRRALDLAQADALDAPWLRKRIEPLLAQLSGKSGVISRANASGPVAAASRSGAVPTVAPAAVSAAVPAPAPVSATPGPALKVAEIARSPFASGLAGALIGAAVVFAIAAHRTPPLPPVAPSVAASAPASPASAQPPLTVTGRVIEIRDEGRTAVIQADDAAYVIEYVERPQAEPKIGATLSVTGNRGVLDQANRRILFVDRDGNPGRPRGVTPEELEAARRLR